MITTSSGIGGDPSAIGRYAYIVADVAREVDGETLSILGDVEVGLVDTEVCSEWLMDGNIGLDTNFVVVDGDDSIASLVGCILIDFESNG